MQPDAAARIAAQLPAHVARVGVFVDSSEAEIREIQRRVGLQVLQFHGDQPPEALAPFAGERIVKVFRVRENFQLQDLRRFASVATAFLLDTYHAKYFGGTGRTLNWHLARKARANGRIILAGGLSPGNIRQAISAAQPYAVDINSGVERVPGEKDAAKLQQLFKNLEEYRIDWQPNSLFPMA
ncbi:MAG: phosphoribosylanthranilate isomerase [Calditrichaeota bacterium]|nr:MAG: phosphoribosylanthranilate isomerase [Calditrichota bacterium]